MLNEIRPAVVILMALTILTGLVYLARHDGYRPNAVLLSKAGQHDHLGVVALHSSEE